MTLLSNSFPTYSAKGNREDLTDVIYDISPTETPVLSMLPRVKATAVKHEWQTDALAAAAANQQLEGDAVGADAATATTRLDNICQISYKVPSVTATQEAVSKAGRKSEMAHQVQKRTKEIKRDMENDITANVAKVTGGATTARKCAGLQTWILTNTSTSSSTPATGDGTDAHTDGTTRVFTEDLLLAAMQTAFTSGATPNMGVTGAFNLEKAAGFTGGATRQVDSLKGKISGYVDVYKTPWGQEIKLIADRFSPSDVMYVIDPEFAAVAYLRPFRMKPLPVTADAMSKLLVVEYTLEMRNQKAHAGVYDLTTS